MAIRKYSLLMYAALATAVVATVGVYRVLQNTKASQQVATRAVAVAAENLAEGASLTAANVQVKQWPVTAVPTGAFSRSDSLLGRVTLVPVFAGEAILPGRLAPVGVAPGLEVKVPPGKRAMAVKINDVAGISGLIQPNSRVDVVVMMRQSQSTPNPVAKVFMEDLRVLSVGTTVQRGADGKAINATTAALEVTPEQAERLALASTEGTIQLVLRGFGDPTSVATTGAVVNDVLGASAVRASPPPPAPQPTSMPAPTRARARRNVNGDAAPSVPPPAVIATAPKAAPESCTVIIHRGERTERRAFAKPDTSRFP